MSRGKDIQAGVGDLALGASVARACSNDSTLRCAAQSRPGQRQPTADLTLPPLFTI